MVAGLEVVVVVRQRVTVVVIVLVAVALVLVLLLILLLSLLSVSRCRGCRSCCCRGHAAQSVELVKAVGVEDVRVVLDCM